ncbi:hypothetical protein SNE35_09675 [Paucibacter sp. R3-3]|uniref:Uncharacterized protein n=1 Tax=Roseateles agri TaxID=3098619 RepID=A0ABU5DES9_9BURK|nr:hypothetical protein [Paucibacter sp. R3-3]MDY0744778.1 hypothetical protein [Paucibacter sp. R3-3]
MSSTASPSLVQLHGLDRSDRVQNYASVAKDVQRVQAALEARGFKCRPSSAVGALFRKALVLSEQWEAKTAAQDVLALMHADEALRIAHAVEAVLDDADAQEAIRRITKSDMHLSTRQPSQGKDALWELDLHLFLKVREVPVRLAEPDLVVQLPGLLGPFGLACKKVYSEDSVDKQLQKGCRQLRAADVPGVVAFNLDDMTPAESLLNKPTRQAAMDYLYALNMAFVERHRIAFQEAILRGRCDAILISTAVQADVEQMSPRFNRFTQLSLWTLDNASAGARLRQAAFHRHIEGRPGPREGA